MLAAEFLSLLLSFSGRGRGTYEPMCSLSFHYKFFTYKAYFPLFQEKIAKRTPSLTDSEISGKS